MTMKRGGAKAPFFVSMMIGLQVFKTKRKEVYSRSQLLVRGNNKINKFVIIYKNRL